ncbi:MAG: hypothetical protein H0X02_07325 [Nitrosomonas sp.]|nr:hypothetical protein [Nitrosomonas sp.]
MSTNKTIPEILANLSNSNPDTSSLEEIDQATQAITQAMLDALPEKYGLHIVKEMEELKEETKDLHPSSNAYREIERSKSMSMGRKVGYNQAISEMETAIKKMGGE